jgi:hypothetical protein
VNLYPDSGIDFEKGKINKKKKFTYFWPKNCNIFLLRTSTEAKDLYAQLDLEPISIRIRTPGPQFPKPSWL